MHKMRLIAVLCAALTAGAALAETPEYNIDIKDHKFMPQRITVLSDTKFALKINNNDATPEEFESNDFNREKIIPGNSSAIIKVGPLKPGVYNFFGEFNPDTAQGTIVVK